MKQRMELGYHYLVNHRNHPELDFSGFMELNRLFVEAIRAGDRKEPGKALEIRGQLHKLAVET
ncbi:MAG: hypothetical protein ABIN58_04590, partial [candidate division WOR-3 bacterium]